MGPSPLPRIPGSPGLRMRKRHPLLTLGWMCRETAPGPRRHCSGAHATPGVTEDFRGDKGCVMWAGWALFGRGLLSENVILQNSSWGPFFSSLPVPPIVSEPWPLRCPDLKGQQWSWLGRGGGKGTRGAGQGPCRRSCRGRAVWEGGSHWQWCLGPRPPAGLGGGGFP